MLLSKSLIAAAGAKQFSFLEVKRNNADQTSYTETNVSLGAPHPNRVIIACVIAQGVTSPNSVTSINIDGTEMTLYQAWSSGQAGWFGILKIPLGTTASTITTTFNQQQLAYAISFFRAVNLNSLAPIVTGGINTANVNTLSLSNTTPARGFSIFAERHNNNDATTWTNVGSVVGAGTNGTAYDSFGLINNLLNPESSTTVSVSWANVINNSMMIQGTFQ